MRRPNSEPVDNDQREVLPPHSNLILIVLCSAQLMLAIDVTVVNVANATIERALGFNSANLEWIVTAYALTFGGFLLLGGRLADLFGRRRLFIWGVLGFGVCSLLAGSSLNASELIGARAAQGFFAALASPAVLSLLSATFPEGRMRQRAYGLWATAGSIGGLTGFTVGGLVTSWLGWRWIFFINVPVAVLVVLGATMLLVRSTDLPGRRPRLDILGAITVTGALVLVIYGLGEAQSRSWGSLHAIVPLACSPALLAVFAVIEINTTEPLVPVALLQRRVAIGNALAILQQAVGISISFLVPLFMQQVWGFSPARAGVATIMLPIGFGLGARSASRLVHRLGARSLICAGFLAVIIGCFWLAHTPVQQSYFTAFLAPLLLRSFGQGLIVVPILVTVTTGVGEQDHGVAAGLYNMSQQLGGAMGLAAIATVAAAASLTTGSKIAGEAHGIRVAFVVVLGIAVFGFFLAFFTMRGMDPLPEHGIAQADGDVEALALLPVGEVE